MNNKCECDRGSVKYYISVTDENGILLDRVGLCAECMKESAVKRALDSLGIQA